MSTKDRQSFNRYQKGIIMLYNVVMDIKQIRLKNTRYLAQSVGGIVALANKLGKSHQQVSHWIGCNPVKNIGHKIAKEIEAAFNKPSNWLDSLHPELYGEEENQKVAKVAQGSVDLSADALEFARLFDELSPINQAALSGAAKAFMNAQKK